MLRPQMHGYLFHGGKNGDGIHELNLVLKEIGVEKEKYRQIRGGGAGCVAVRD